HRDRCRRRHAADRSDTIPVGQSFRASIGQMIVQVYLPGDARAHRQRRAAGTRVAIIGTLLAETKLSNRGIGHLIIQAYSTFDMPRMYALLIVLFALAIGAKAMLGGLARSSLAGPAPAATRMPVQ
ncbi:MAG: hypothetical protein ABI541_01110, partial [Betaproteobacteria bacterium]